VTMMMMKMKMLLLMMAIKKEQQPMKPHVSLRHRRQSLLFNNWTFAAGTDATFQLCLYSYIQLIKSNSLLGYTNDKRTCLHTINKLPRRTAQQVPARRPGITTGFSQARSCHTTALSGCNQPHEAYSPVGIHQMAPPSTRSVNKPTTYFSTPEG